jgi:hypothetical protein
LIRYRSRQTILSFLREKSTWLHLKKSAFGIAINAIAHLIMVSFGTTAQSVTITITVRIAQRQQINHIRIE